MTLTSGTRLGPYEILGLLGVGGMGEVYRARDTRLEREVAVKVLPAAFSRDPDRLRRFEQEARAAGTLNHPNILTIHDIGTHEGAPFVVSELLQGETLRQRLEGGAIPSRKTIDYALQAARGLAAAHQKGIVHRDLKPENLFLTTDDRLKILDFGLAKLIQPEPPSGDTADAVTVAALTEPGMVMGTAGYMSPEQVRGRPVDHRADLFAFGAILYEMLTGRRAFAGASAVEAMHAILKEDPTERSSTPAELPPALERVVRHCLEKSPEQRFQSAQDLGFALEAASGLTSATAIAPAAVVPAPKRRLWPALAGVVILVAVALASFFAGGRAGQTSRPQFQRLTFRRGIIGRARFAPDGQTVVYGAGWDLDPWQLFSTRPGNTESRPFGMQADISAISSSGEMALLAGAPRRGPPFVGTLARAPLAGGAPRDVLDNVRDADWAPDGKSLAVVRVAGGRNRIEFPIGKVVYDSPSRIGGLRLSPKGDRIAFVEAGATICVVDLSGKKTTLSAGWIEVTAPVWSSSEEVWFSAPDGKTPPAVRAVTLSGKLRLVERGVGALILQDISRDGRVLVTNVTWKGGIHILPPGETKERDLSWLDWSELADLSADGKTLLFNETREAGGPMGAIYLRKTDGAPAVRLGEGEGLALSPDGKWVLTMTRAAPPQLVLLPAGAGEARSLPNEGIHPLGASWFPDGDRLLVVGREPGHAARNYALRLSAGGLRPITPEGVLGGVLSPDGKVIAVTGPGRKLALYDVEGGDPRPVPGDTAGYSPIRWSADGRTVYVRRPGEVPIQVYRLDLATGRKELWREIAPYDPTGILYIAPILITPDGKSYAYSYARHQVDLYVVEGLR